MVSPATEGIVPNASDIQSPQIIEFNTIAKEPNKISISKKELKDADVEIRLGEPTINSSEK